MIRVIFLTVFLAFFLTFPSFAAERQELVITDPSPVTTEGLSQVEKENLDKNYQFTVRGKQRLLITSAGGSAASSGGASPFAAGALTYHRYLDAAIELHKAGHLEESLKIFEYLNRLDPGDDYVRSYISRIKREIKSKNSGWDNYAASEAASMKKHKLRSLIETGRDSYNSKDFDNALICFNDVLAMDPENPTAKEYMRKLKNHYLIKLGAEETVNNWERGNFSYFDEPRDAPKNNFSFSIKEAADAMLDRMARPSTDSVEPAHYQFVETKAASSIRAEEILQEVEFGMEADAIISAKRAEEAREKQIMLGVGDVLRMTVANHPELSGDMTIQSNGRISVPLTGDEVDADGLTIGELSTKVIQTVDKYVESPSVSVYVLTSKSQIFYVIDDTSCTPYPITRPDLTLRDALFISDWGNNRALGRVLVIRPSARNPVVKKVDAFNMIYRGDLRDNIRIVNGDVIYVPLTVMAKVTKSVYDAIAPFSALRAARDQYLDTKWNEVGWENLYRMPPDPNTQSLWGDNSGSGGGGV